LQEFFDGVHEGNMIADLVSKLLEKSGYLVFANGYESRFSEVKKQLNEKDVKNSLTVRKIKCSPDLLVFDERRKDAVFVEVKLRRAPNERSIAYLDLAAYKYYWPECILVLVIPHGNILYAQRVSELDVKDKYDAFTDFDKFQEIFTYVEPDTLDHYRPKLLQAISKK
jgi:hypothetical protein